MRCTAEEAPNHKKDSMIIIEDVERNPMVKLRNDIRSCAKSQINCVRMYKLKTASGTSALLWDFGL